MTINEKKPQAARVDEIARALRLILEPGQVAELRCLGTRKGTISGYFDDIEKMAHAAAALSGKVEAIYVMLNPVDPALLARAAMLPEESKAATGQAQSNGKGGRGSFDLEAWIAEHGLDVIGPKPWGDSRRWLFHICPWNDDHQNGSAYLLQFASGAIVAGCHHNGCSGKDWHALRDMVEPGWRNQAMRNGRPAEKNQDERVLSPILVYMSDVKPEDVEWVWNPYIPKGKLTLLEGDPGVGKTWLALQLATSVSRGNPFLDQDGSPGVRREPGKVLYLSAEDGKRYF